MKAKEINFFGNSRDLSIQPPQVQAFNLSYDNDTVTLTWERGDGDKVVLFLRKNYAVNQLPKDHLTYNEGEYICDVKVLYKGTETSLDLSNLEEGLYHVRAFEFNGTASVEKYLRLVANNNPISFIISQAIIDNARLLEDGGFRLLEDGGYRLLE